MHTHTNIYLYRELQDHLVLDFLGFQIYLVRKSISAQKASTDGNGLERELPLLCSLFLKYLQICVRLLTTALIFCSVRFGECWKFLVGAQITHYEAYLVSYGKRKMQSWLYGHCPSVLEAFHLFLHLYWYSNLTSNYST